MSMQKKTLAILVALSVGVSFGAAAGGKKPRPIPENPKPQHHFWKKAGGGLSERGPGHLLSDVDFSQSLTVTSTTKAYDIQVGNPTYGDYEVDADADGDNEINANAGGKAQRPTRKVSRFSRRGGERGRNHNGDHDLNKIVAKGGTATGGDLDYKLVIKGNTVNYTGPMNGFVSGNTVSGIGNAVNSAVSINAQSTTF